jgi:hypothetical protein
MIGKLPNLLKIEYKEDPDRNVGKLKSSGNGRNQHDEKVTEGH